MQRHKIAYALLIAGLVLVLGYFGIDKFRNPIIWIGWMPAFTDGLLGYSNDFWLKVAGVVEVILAVLILIPWKHVQRAGCILIILYMLGVLTQVGWNEIGVRDIAILLSSGALFFLM